MASLNRIDLIGRLGKDPEVRQFEGGNQMCTFTLATSESYTDRNGQKQESTEWHNIVLNGKLAAVAPYVHKGSQLYVSGKLRTRSYQTQNGETRYVTEVVGMAVQLLDPKPQTAQPAQAAPAARPATPPTPQYTPTATPPPSYQPAPAVTVTGPQPPAAYDPNLHPEDLPLGF